MTWIAAVLSLRAKSSLSQPGFTGYKAQSWFLDQINNIDPNRAGELHDGSQPRPYSVSPLMDGEQPAVDIQAGSNYWLRITCFESGLTNLLRNALLPVVKQAYLSPVLFDIIDWTSDDANHPYAAEVGFEGLSQLSFQVRADSIQLIFDTPTFFGANGFDTALPIPRLVYASAWQRLKPFLDVDPTIDAGAFAERNLVVSACNLYTREEKIKNNGRLVKNTGFVGSVTYRLVCPKGDDISAGEWAKGAGLVRFLSAALFFTGTGRHTPRGFGLTRAYFT